MEERRNTGGGRRLQFYDDDDARLAEKLVFRRLLADDLVTLKTDEIGVEKYTVHQPDEKYAFLHEAAIAEYGGTLFASWYNCPEKELAGHTPIRERRSRDGGRSWGPAFTVAEDESDGIMFCPPVYAEDDTGFYMLVNEMTAPDHIHALDLYKLEDDASFGRLWSRAIPFKLNTNALRLPNGRLMLSGRVGELDGFPNTPAVMISDSGRVDADWRLVRIAADGVLPDGTELLHPEICPIVCGGRIYMFCRNDRRRTTLMYISEDMGESWTGPYTHDIPFISSKIYAGTLEDGRNYVIGNIDEPDRSRLAVYFSRRGSMCFDRRVIIEDRAAYASHYPAAFERGGRLYMIYTVNETWDRRGAALAVIDTEKIG